MTRVVLRDPLGDATVVAAWRASGEDRVAALDRHEAAFWLRGRDAFDGRTLARLYELAYGHELSGQRAATALLERRVEEAIESGRLLVVVQKRRRIIMPVEARIVVGPADDPKSWIEIELVDDEGKPVPDEEYAIVTGDGRVRKGTLDANGRAREEEIDPADCQVTFPRLHEWRAA